ncbi:C6 transcription factor, putative [Talaromyces stipitatus ATCC 10500]|uniref:C6 transcription factor, putative n=1 Tax=Talaromyces stipitatus (strain ATCC 10500 / CBS 375.48 / QM 6759 / NRRL 1006) TaxID=441959 RepID=B8LZE7_TALSN|nr:C6 transcription factor, putative [Talaromyces stipitatus ATCC 10500]EED21700.1 C6 transcription factor, putative [Talaromyces stipitatus ATCC 10500]
MLYSPSHLHLQEHGLIIRAICQAAGLTELALFWGYPSYSRMYAYDHISSELDHELYWPMPDYEQGQSPDVESSAAESDNEQFMGSNGAQESRRTKRKRPLMVSCELCKQRKVKCDRAQPSCGWCARNGQTCEYKERRKPGLRAGYGKELEQRLDRLEAIIQTQAQLIETHIIRNQHLQHDNHNQCQEPRLPSYVSHTSPSELSAATGPSPQNSVFPGEPSAYPIAQRLANSTLSHHNATGGSPSAMSAKIHHTPMVSNGISHSTPHSQVPSVPDRTGTDFSHNDSSLTVPVSLFNNQEQSLSNSELELPPYDLLYALVDLYFEHVNSWCPILHRRTTLDTLFGPSPLEEADRVVLHAIVATALRFSLDPRLNEANRKRYHESSKQRVLLYGIENSSVKAIQALVILSLDFVGSSNGPPGWKLLALIARSVVQIGLAVERNSGLDASIYPSIYTLRANVLPDSETWIEDESRRRLFWMVYLLDRYSTIATAFDFALDEKEINRKLPCREEYFIGNQPVETRWFRAAGDHGNHSNHGDNVDSFGFYIEILSILSRIHLFLKRPVDIGALSDVEEWQATYRKLDNELSAWEFNLPTEYAFGNASRLLQSMKRKKGLQCDWVMLHATYQTTVIRLHSSAAYPTTRSPIFTPSYSASQRCLLAVDNILTLTRLVVENNMLDKLGPPFAFSLWVSARLLLVHGSTIAHTVSPDIYLFVDTLAQMGRHWKVAERYSTILKRVLDEYSEYEQTAGTESERVTPSSVKILADMRRCAFDLDFLISRQPQHGPKSSAASNSNGLVPLQSANSSERQNADADGSLLMSRSLTNTDFEYLDVFGFFNVPRVPNMPTPLSALGMTSPDGNGNNTNNTNGLSTTNPMSINGPTTMANNNEFNITNYLVPTPETDWLFPQPHS